VQPKLSPHLCQQDDAICNRFADEEVGIAYWKLAVLAILMMATGAAALEYAVPYRSELLVVPHKKELAVLGSFAWMPAISGIVIGLGQIPIMLTQSDTLGMSSSFMTLTSPFSYLVDNPAWKRSLPTSMSRLWQVLFYWVAAPLGAFMSATLSGRKFGAAGCPPAQCIIGGIILIFGARMSGGCTQGHGISGIGVLYIGAMIAVPSMICGGMCTAGVLELLDAYSLS